jgi:uncharacterized membrane protein YjdF
VFAPLAFGAVRLWALGPILIAVELAGALWIVRILSTREIPVIFSTLGPPVLALAGYAVIRYGLSEIEPIARGSMMQSLGAVLLFFLVLNHTRHRWHITMLVWVLIGTGSLIAVYALWQVLMGGTWVWAFPQYNQYLGSASGTFIRPSHCAAYLQMVFPIAAANSLFSRRSFEQRLAMAAACLVMGAALLLAASPNGWLGCLASVIVLLIYVVKRCGVARGKSRTATRGSAWGRACSVGCIPLSAPCRGLSIRPAMSISACLRNTASSAAPSRSGCSWHS